MVELRAGNENLGLFLGSLSLFVLWSLLMGELNDHREVV